MYPKSADLLLALSLSPPPSPSSSLRPPPRRTDRVRQQAVERSVCRSVGRAALLCGREGKEAKRNNGDRRCRRAPRGNSQLYTFPRLPHNNTWESGSLSSCLGECARCKTRNLARICQFTTSETADGSFLLPQSQTSGHNFPLLFSSLAELSALLCQ